MNVFPVPKKISIKNETFYFSGSVKIKKCDFKQEEIFYALSHINFGEQGTDLNISFDPTYKKEQYTINLGEDIQIIASTKYGVNYAIITAACGKIPAANDN